MNKIIAALVLVALAAQLSWAGTSGGVAAAGTSPDTTPAAALVKDINPVPAPVNYYPPYGYSSISAGVLFFSSDLLHSEGALYRVNPSTATVEMLHGEYPRESFGCPVVLHDILYYLIGGSSYSERVLWKSDGTAAGTVPVTTVTTGGYDQTSRCLYLYKDRLLFASGDSEHGSELWSSDGTAAGTALLKDIKPGEAGSDPGNFVTMGGQVYFSANGKLWKTDGTASGTVRVGDVGAGSLNVLGDRIFFSSDDGVHGPELWVTDGTEAGTHLVKDIYPGPTGSMWQLGGDYRMGAAGGRVLFPAVDPAHGMEIWASDGTEAGTVLLKDISPGSGSGVEWYTPFGMAGGLAYFARGSTLWKTDGTEAGTAPIADLGGAWFWSEPAPMAEMGGWMYFRAKGELYRTDGSPAGRSMVKNLNPAGDSNPTMLTSAGGGLYFGAFDAANGMQPWRSDGTEAGTAIVGIVTSSAGSSGPYGITECNGMAYFVADDGAHGRELWRSDGTADGTRLVRDIAPGIASSLPEVDPFGVSGSFYRVVVGGVLYFVADDGQHGHELWRSDGTEAGTRMVKDISTGSEDSYPHLPTALKGSLYFFAHADTGDWLYRSDGTDAGTVQVKRVGAGSSAVVGDTLFFAGGDGQVGSGLWKSDGTAEGTVMVRHLNLTYPLSGPASFVEAGGLLYFLADATEGKGLYRSDGTGYGTFLVKAFDGFDLSSVGLTAVNDQIYLVVCCVGGYQLWRSDGTAAGTLVVKDFLPDRWGAQPPAGLTGAGGVLYFWADDGVHGQELWRSDGTAAGTRLVRDLHPGLGNSMPPSEPQLGPVVFSGSDGLSGDEAWTISDTAEGVRLSADIVPGPGGSYPRGFAIAGSRLFFSAFTIEAGRELWSVPVSRISGRVTAGGAPVAKVPVSDGSGRLSITDSQGRYQFDEVMAGSYSIVSSSPCWSFAPVSWVVAAPPGGDAKDFAASGACTITGRLVTAGGKGISGAAVSDGHGHEATSDTNGDYMLASISDGVYTVSPALRRYTFAPPVCQVTLPPSGVCPDMVGTALPAVYLPLIRRR